MEDELIDCPHCNTSNILITKEGLCPNCKQILTDKNNDNTEVSIAEQKTESNELHQRKPWDKKPMIKRIPWTFVRKSIVFIGVAILLLCPVVFFCIIAFLPKKGVRSPEEEAIIWTQLLTFIGWLTCEIGLILSKTSITVNIISRIAIYLYIILGQLLLGIIKMFSAPWP